MSIVIVECGSAARGDANENSDVDYVCIWSDSPPDYRKISAKYRGAMFYSVDSIRRMKKKGSLFLTHLDVDALYIEGNRKLLQHIRGYRPRNDDIEKQLRETIDFIKIIHWHPDNSIGKLWLSDVLYVALRNCLYCRNALNGRYVFGYEDALKELALSKIEQEALLILREGKYAYRKRTPGLSQDIETNVFQVGCEAITGLSIQFAKGGVTTWTHNWRRDYWGERLLERAILNNEYVDNGFLDKLRNHNYNKNSIKLDLKKITEYRL